MSVSERESSKNTPANKLQAPHEPCWGWAHLYWCGRNLPDNMLSFFIEGNLRVISCLCRCIIRWSSVGNRCWVWRENELCCMYEEENVFSFVNKNKSLMLSSKISLNCIFQWRFYLLQASILYSSFSRKKSIFIPVARAGGYIGYTPGIAGCYTWDIWNDCILTIKYKMSGKCIKTSVCKSLQSLGFFILCWCSSHSPNCLAHTCFCIRRWGKRHWLLKFMLFSKRNWSSWL